MRADVSVAGCCLMAAICGAYPLAMGGGADEIALVTLDTPWRYRLANDPTADIEAWRRPGFDDQDWATGLGGFSGRTGVAWDITLLPASATPWAAATFRTQFQVDDPRTVVWPVLRADYRSGLVAYINGVEAARRSLPEGPVTLDTLATSPDHKFGEAIPLDPAPGSLLTGTNLLVVEVHKASLADLTLAFKGELLANFARGPIVHNLSSNAVTLSWDTPLPATRIVHYGINGVPSKEVTGSDLQTRHEVRLTALQPDSLYTYQVAGQADGQTVTSPEFNFRTFKVSGPVEFLVVGDTGTGGAAQRWVRDILTDQPSDLVLHNGDVVYNSFSESLVDLRHFSIYRSLLTGRPMFPVYGNHDLYLGDSPYRNAFILPTNSVTGTEHFYSFDHGDVHFTALFLTQRGQAISWPDYAMEQGSPQYQWLTNDLANTDRPWKVVFGHVPLASSGGRRFDSYGGIRDQEEYQRILLPVFERYGVQLYLAGHDHIYERLGPVGGTHLVVSGGGGYSLYRLTERDPKSAQFHRLFHLVKVRATTSHMEIEALDQNGQVFDEFRIQRRPPEGEPPFASWHSPAEAEGPPDGAGNRTGQVFDFPSMSIPAVAGRDANLGELQVSLDHQFVHLGLRNVMLPDSRTVALFVGVPEVAGVDSLTGLGDGIPDPAGEGVEGLDALEHLAFEGFHPVVACLLGDEFADGTYRSFVREPGALDSGQGVFRLEPGFREVSDARVQQFDRSPQIAVVANEQRADFIVVSIPREALGDVQAGGLLQVGAVAAHCGVHLEATNFVAEIDSGYLGLSLTEDEGSAMILQSLSIQLPEDPDPDQDGLPSTDELALGTDPNHPDTDRDELADGWEVLHGLDPRSDQGEDGATADPDQDGLSNAGEQAAGTDPRDPQSVLALRIRPAREGPWELVWTGVQGRTYVLESAEQADGLYNAVPGEDFPRLGSDREEVAPAALEQTSRFYRLRLLTR